jgi:hypothetical protein
MRTIRVLLAHVLFSAAALGGELHFTEAGARATRLDQNFCKGDLVELSEQEVGWRDENANLLRESLKVVLRIELQPIQPFAAGVKYTTVELTDGSLLQCSQLLLKGKDVLVNLAASEAKFTIPLTTIAYILNDAQDPAVRKEWHEKVLAKKGNQDILVIKLNDVVNPIEGTFGEANDKGQIAFEYQAGGSRSKRELEPSRVHGLVFVRRNEADTPAPICRVQDVRGNLLAASKVILEGNNFSISTASGTRFVYPRTAIARIDYGSDKVAYLSDLKPAELIQKTRQGRKDNLGIDKNLENTAIQLEGQVYGKGLAIHAHTELVYNLDGKYNRFHAIIGMDDTVGGDGRPVVKIHADGKELFSATITRKEKCQTIDTNIKGARQLRIMVTSEELFDFGDHVDLADAKVSK